MKIRRLSETMHTFTADSRRPHINDIKKTALLKRFYLFSKSPLSESNQRPTDYKSVALPAELRRLFTSRFPDFPLNGAQK